MFIDNSIITLIVIYIQKNDYDITPYRRLHDLLPLEKSHISQNLATHEKKGLIMNPNSAKYFTQIQITPEGIRVAERYIAFLNKILKFQSKI